MAIPNNLIYTTLYRSKAHVFQINLETRNSWLQLVESAIPIALVASIPSSSDGHVDEAGERDLRIVGHNHDGEKVLDAVIQQKTSFAKRSQKFGQWTDPSGMVYGLGFETEAELSNFTETFQRLRDDILTNNTNNNSIATSPNQVPQQHPSNSATMAKHLQNSQVNLSSNGNGSLGSQAHLHQQQVHGVEYPPRKPPQGIARQPTQGSQSLNNSNNSNNMDSSLNNTGNNGNSNETNGNYPRSQSLFGLHGNVVASTSHNIDVESKLEQMKYENERLKQALEESSKNASIWHDELQKLTTNNLKLTQALHDSKAHVKDWERELLNLGDENKELRSRIKALESTNDPDKLDEYKESIQKLYVEEFEDEVRKKNDKIDQLERALQGLELKVKTDKLEESATVVENVISLHQKQKFDVLNSKLENLSREISGISNEYAQLVEKMYH